MIVSFYPGPSKVYEKVPKYVIEGYRKRIFSANHRSPEFHELYFETEKVFKKKLNVPKDYRLFFLSSATEVWEVIAQSLIQKGSFHIYNGAFGEKWMSRTKDLGTTNYAHQFSIDHELVSDELKVPSNYDFICLTQNETSNGTEIPKRTIDSIRAKFPEYFIAIDGTSSMAGIRYNWNSGDLWYASVQKCFGLPSGMAVMVCSPRLIDYAKKHPEKGYYNSFVSIVENADRGETTHTPNILNIYLLYRSLRDSPKLINLEQKIEKRVLQYDKLVNRTDAIDFLARNKNVRSRTVIALKSSPEIISNLKSEAHSNGLILGNGYGSWKDSTVRIANFPALRDVEVDRLRSFLKRHFNIQ